MMRPVPGGVLVLDCRPAAAFRTGAGWPETVTRASVAKQREKATMTLKIMPHGRLQEWVAEAKGYFSAEGLDYRFVTGGDYGIHSPVRDAAGETGRARSRPSAQDATART
jgi:hypothetical protein